MLICDWEASRNPGRDLARNALRSLALRLTVLDHSIVLQTRGDDQVLPMRRQSVETAEASAAPANQPHAHQIVPTSDMPARPVGSDPNDCDQPVVDGRRHGLRRRPHGDIECAALE
jgi:hypothetical protein